MNPFVLTNSSPNALRRLDLQTSACESVRQLFADAAQNFQSGVENWVEYDPNDLLEEGEGFQISEYALDAIFLKALEQPMSVNRVEAKTLAELSIKSVIGHNENIDAPEFYFQRSDVSRILQPGQGFLGLLWTDASTFEELKQPVFALRTDIVAIWKQQTLYFKDFYWANRILGLKQYYQEATEQQVKDFAGHLHFSTGGYEVLAGCSDWHRKRVTSLIQTGVLDNFSISDFQKAATAIGYQLPLEKGKIKLPIDKTELRELLDFLGENLYIGSFSENHWKSSGKRKRTPKTK